MRILKSIHRDQPAPGPALPIEVAEAWVTDPPPTGRILLQSLGPNGFSIRDPQTDEPLPLDGARLNAMGAHVTTLVDIGGRRDPERCRVSIPGLPLSLVPEGRRVAVHDARGELDIGYLDDAIAPDVAAAIRGGADLEAISLWEVRALDGSRTELRVLILPVTVETIHGLETPVSARPAAEPAIDELLRS